MSVTPKVSTAQPSAVSASPQRSGDSSFLGNDRYAKPSKGGQRLAVDLGVKAGEAGISAVRGSYVDLRV